MTTDPEPAFPSEMTCRWCCVACWTEAPGPMPRACPTCGSVRLWASANAGAAVGAPMRDHFYDYLGATVAHHGAWVGEMLGTGFRRNAPAPRAATPAAISDVEARQAEAPLLLGHGGCPGQEELDAAPLLCGWQLVLDPENRLRAEGHVLLPDGGSTPALLTTAVVLLDRHLTWLRTLTTLYRLGATGDGPRSRSPITVFRV